MLTLQSSLEGDPLGATNGVAPAHLTQQAVTPRDPNDGELEFVSHKSSKMEELFLEQLPDMIFPTEYTRADKNVFGFTSGGPPAAYCEFVNTFEKQIMHWLTKIEARETLLSLERVLWYRFPETVQRHYAQTVVNRSNTN